MRVVLAIAVFLIKRGKNKIRFDSAVREGFRDVAREMGFLGRDGSSK